LIKNYGDLVRSGHSAPDRRARRLCLAALEAALNAVDPYRCVRSNLSIARGRILAGNRSISISRVSGIRVLAVGKASLRMARAALSALEPLLIGGIVLAPKGKHCRTIDGRFEVHFTGHPFPDSAGLRASQRVMDEITKMARDELLLCLISGGASALLPLPAEGIRLADEIAITEQLVKSGASIHEINTVRRHISELKGGRLVELCPASIVLSLLISDVPGNQLHDIGSGLTAEDPTTFRDAVDVLRGYGIWRAAPSRVRSHLLNGIRGLARETPKPGKLRGRNLHNVVIADNRTACKAANQTLSEAGISSEIFTTSAEMDASDMGSFLATASDQMTTRHKTGKGRAVIAGGETTVRVHGRGKGGRNQETVLSAVERIAGLNGVVVAAMGTDGVDGNSNAAGAIIDGNTFFRAKRKGLVIDDYIRRNDSNGFFRAIKDCLITGPTGTNVGDIYLALSVV